MDTQQIVHLYWFGSWECILRWLFPLLGWLDVVSYAIFHIATRCNNISLRQFILTLVIFNKNAYSIQAFESIWNKQWKSLVEVDGQMSYQSENTKCTGNYSL